MTRIREIFLQRLRSEGGILTGPLKHYLRKFSNLSFIACRGESADNSCTWVVSWLHAFPAKVDTISFTFVGRLSRFISVFVRVEANEVRTHAIKYKTNYTTK